MRSAQILLGSLMLMGMVGCRRDNAEELGSNDPAATPYNLVSPYYFPTVLVPLDNPLTVEGIELGRRLYYDPLLSTNGPFEGFSCSSCHDQALSFCAPNAGTSVLPHINLAWSRNFLWNGRVQGNVEDIMRFEVQEFFQVDVSVLQADPGYAARFRRVFGTEVITEDAVAKALAQWFRRLVSSNSRFDGYIMHVEELTDLELTGMMLYLTETGDCFHCHGLPLMTDNTYHNIGLDSTFVGADQGRYIITGDDGDLGKFKAPTLRNVALTAPYMHDGRFQTLEEVVEHYNSGVKRSPSLDPIMTKPGQTTELGLDPERKAALVAFLYTLTDQSFVTDTALADPF